MLNWLLGFVAAALWATAYGWYFSADIRRWLWRRRNRRALAEMQRVQAYAAWMRRPPPPPRRSPASVSAAAPPPRPQRPPAVVIPFPPRDRTRPSSN